jgi:hypothetical protein
MITETVSCTKEIQVTHASKKEVLTDPESRQQFERTTCADCGIWLGDQWRVEASRSNASGGSVEWLAQD